MREEGWLNRSSGRSTGQGRPSALRAEACSQKQSPAPARPPSPAVPTPPGPCQLAPVQANWAQQAGSLPEGRRQLCARWSELRGHSRTIRGGAEGRGRGSEGTSSLPSLSASSSLHTQNLHPGPGGPGPECSPAVPVKAVLTPGSGVRPVLHIPLARPLCPAWMRGGPPASQQPHGLCGRGAWN